MIYGRHPQWETVESCLDKISKHLGSSIHDSRCGKTWDVGQAVCAEAYGPDWMSDGTFREWDSKDDSEPPEPHYLSCAARMAGGYVPKWAIDQNGRETDELRDEEGIMEAGDDFYERGE